MPCIATDREGMDFIERYTLLAWRIGWMDAHLLASTQLTGTASLWAADRRLKDVAASLDLVFEQVKG